ncbi:methyl-accepting chemotaxis protein [Desulfonatronovibrio hydrogenovorans]|uniref:methyl-accepting chemotaxis protein n=1 Tax=Desulfonatronovibrio hydrogenovorans TaxID=53245 RepID=UPI00048D2E7D|nr:methyl-accepting chemotaxis protein [Desulfonatronovibrio hydrogenovorans]
MKLSIFWKVLGMVIIPIILVSCFIFMATNYLVSRSMDEDLDASLNSHYQTFNLELKEIQRSLSAIAYKSAINPDVAFAIESVDVDYLAGYGQELILQLPSVDLVTISDAYGRVVARGHSNQASDSVRSQHNIEQALLGTSVAGIEKGSIAGLSLRASHPVRLHGRIVGVVTMGMDLSSTDFVQSLKNKLGMEIAVFDGDMSVSSTLEDLSPQAKDRSWNNPDITEAVLGHGETYRMMNTFSGQRYEAIYWPLTDIQGNTVGMFFLGQSKEALESIQASIFHSILFVTVLVGSIMSLAGILFAKFFSRPISLATRFATGVAEGNLDQHLEIKNRDELGALSRALNTMLKHLKQKIAEAHNKSEQAVKESEKAKQARIEAQQAGEKAEQARREGIIQAALDLEDIVDRLRSGSEELSSHVQRSHSGAEDQKNRIRETAAVMEQMNATMLEVARNASSAATGAEKASQDALKGSEIVSDSMKAINLVRDMSTSAQQNMNDLGRQVTQIGSIMAMIEDIADQTNLLALNAAIEAARAGNAGRGFAVVADEVRKLAEKTMNATKEVDNTIRSIQQVTRDNILEMEKAVSAANNATSHADMSGQALQNIVSLAGTAAGQIRSIAAATQDQSVTSQQVTRSTDGIRCIADETATIMNQAATAIRNQAQQAEELQNLIEKLKQS